MTEPRRIGPIVREEADRLEIVGPFDPDELVRWAEMYGHPEEWAKRAQAAHMRAEKAEAELARLRGRAA